MITVSEMCVLFMHALHTSICVRFGREEREGEEEGGGERQREKYF